MKKSRGDRAFGACNATLLALSMLVFLYPLYYTVIASISEPYSVVGGQVSILPVGFTLESYQKVFENKDVWIGYRNSLFYTLGGTAWSLIITLPAAYTLSKKWLPGRNALAWVFLFTMYFSGGLVPFYLLMKQLCLINNPLVMVLPGALSVYNMIVTRVYLETNIPDELYESATLDGANEGVMFFRIALPLSKPILAVMALFYASTYWNDWFGALMFISDTNLYPLQMVLRNILLMNQTSMESLSKALSGQSALEMQLWHARQAQLAETMKYALIFIASAPMLAAYPFVQKYFVKGIMIGSLKG